MSQEEVESQLSAMFDGELPAAECELLSRRIDRDENLRARWARYALIGAAMRSEPVATARKGFALRVRAALAGDARALRPARGALARHYRSAALAAVLVGGVAGLSILLLRSAVPQLPAIARGHQGARELALANALPSPAPVAAGHLAGRAQTAQGQGLGAQPSAAGGEPVSYVTPPNASVRNLPLRSELANFIVAHSEYSVPLMQPDLLSELVSSEAVVGVAAPSAAASDASAGRSPQAITNAAAAAPGHGN